MFSNTWLQLSSSELARKFPADIHMTKPKHVTTFCKFAVIIVNEFRRLRNRKKMISNNGLIYYDIHLSITCLYHLVNFCCDKQCSVMRMANGVGEKRHLLRTIFFGRVFCHPNLDTPHRQVAASYASDYPPFIFNEYSPHNPLNFHTRGKTYKKCLSKPGL